MEPPARRPRAGLSRNRLLLAVAAVALAAGVAASIAAGGSSRPAPAPTASVSSAYLARKALAIVPAPAPVAPARSKDKNGVPIWHGDVPVAARYLGLEPRRLRRDLRAGRSLAQIAATTPGHSVGGLVAALVSAREARLTAAAAAGRLPGKAEARRLAQLPARVASEVARSGGPDLGAAAAAPGIAARYLGLTPQQLHAQLRAGHSLAQIADATPGKSAAGLVAAMVAVARSRLDAAVAAGTLSARAEAKRLAVLPVRLRARLERVPHLRAPRG
jgi:energy-converting hydrogenase Eha subunit B